MNMIDNEYGYSQYQERMFRLRESCASDMGLLAVNTVMPGLLPEQYRFSPPTPEVAAPDPERAVDRTPVRARGNVALLHTVQRPAPTEMSILGYAEAA